MGKIITAPGSTHQSHNWKILLAKRLEAIRHTLKRTASQRKVTDSEGCPEMLLFVIILVFLVVPSTLATPKRRLLGGKGRKIFAFTKISTNFDKQK